MLLWKDPSSPVVTRFGITGDFLPASGLRPAATQTWAGMAAPLSTVFDPLDFTLVNLECPVNVGSLAPRMKASLGDTFSAPQESLDYLRALKCKVVSLANNHSYDYGSPGVSATRAALDAAGILSLGADSSVDDPPEVGVLDVGKGARIGVWCAALAIRECATRNKRVDLPPEEDSELCMPALKAPIGPIPRPSN